MVASLFFFFFSELYHDHENKSSSLLEGENLWERKDESISEASPVPTEHRRGQLSWIRPEEISSCFPEI